MGRAQIWAPHQPRQERQRSSPGRARRRPFGRAAGTRRTRRCASVHPLTMPHQLIFAIREAYDTRLEGITIEARLGLGASSVYRAERVADAGLYAAARFAG